MVGQDPKLIFSGRKITFRRASYCNLATAIVFSKNDSWSGFGGWRGPETYFQGWENSF